MSYQYDENRLTKIVKPDESFLEYGYEQRGDEWVVVETHDKERAPEHFRYSNGVTRLEMKSSGLTTSSVRF